MPKLRGEPYPAIPLFALLFFFPLAFPVTLLILRWRLARRAERVASGNDDTFVVLATLRFRKRWRRAPQPELALFPLDAGPDAKPLAVVPLLREPPRFIPARTPAEAKGQLRPYGVVVARIGDWIAWPAAPAKA